MQEFDDRLSTTSTNSSNETQKLKTEICKYWKEQLECPYGSNCFFAHGDNQLVTKELPKNYRTKLCQNFSQSYCKYGSRCQFAHPMKPAKLPALKYWTQVDNIIVGSQKKKHRLQIFKQISSGNYKK
ncbi:hypothetical protein pb186bvf_003209 [Paramecium bursaria]